MAMTPPQALRWLIPGGLASSALLGLLALPVLPAMNMGIAILGLLPSLIVVCWGTIKFRSYYEVQRTRSDYLTMVNATLIQLLALAFSAFLFVQLLNAIDLITV